VDLLPKVKLEMVVPSQRADEVVQTIVNSARTGKIGDGKVFVYDVVEAIRIRNDDRGEGALYDRVKSLYHSRLTLDRHERRE
jgi:nitrogen regulatory protein P-II 1